jgi:hypothetical protein
MRAELFISERRRYYRGFDPGILPAKAGGAAISPKRFKWYELIFWKDAVLKVLMFVASIFQAIPRLAPIGQLISRAIKDDRTLLKLIKDLLEQIIELIKSWRKKK